MVMARWEAGKMTLPQFQSDDRNFQMMQNVWAQKIDPLLAKQIVNGNLLQNVSLASGSNTINHKLGRKLQGWLIVRQRASASVYDTQDSNQHQDLTLTLTSSASVSVDLWVF
jgi:uncharacterized lipoprotein YmbA